MLYQKISFYSIFSGPFYNYLTLLRDFRANISWCFLTVVWATNLKSLGLFIYNAEVWMVSSHLISKSFSRCTNTLVTVPSTLITVGISITHRFLSFFSSLARSWMLSFFSLSFSFTPWSARTAKSTIRQFGGFHFFFFFFFFFWLTFTGSCRLAEIRWSVCIWKY